MVEEGRWVSTAPYNRRKFSASGATRRAAETGYCPRLHRSWLRFERPLLSMNQEASKGEGRPSAQHPNARLHFAVPDRGADAVHQPITSRSSATR